MSEQPKKRKPYRKGLKSEPPGRDTGTGDANPPMKAWRKSGAPGAVS